MSISHDQHGRPVAIPSTSALRAFEAAGRLLNFTRAADELHLTQSAISHQIRDLESHLGVRLFDREPRGLRLTEAGRSYLPQVREALARLRLATDAVTVARHDAVLTVSVSPNFASKWLVPRLGAFSAAHPDLDLRISASRRHVEFTHGDIDLAIRHGDGDWPRLHVTRLCEEYLFPVCSPALLADAGPLRAADLAAWPLLHDRSRDAWRHWLERAGSDAAATVSGPVFSDTSLVIDAAISGQGIALARSALADLDLAAGRLVRPIPDAQPLPYAYWIVCPSGTAELPKIARFRGWLLAQTAGTGDSAGASSSR